MALTTNSFGTTFDLSQSTKVFLFTDYTNYAGQGVNPADCKCVLEITAPGGAVIYNNNNFSNPDINPSVSPLNIIQILVPLSANGLPAPGMYTFKMTTQVDDGVNPVYTVDSSYSFTYEYVSPVVSINQTVNCVSPLFTSTDLTVYTVNNVIPTISRVHSIYFPIASGLSTLTGSAQVLTRGANQFANGTQTTQITTSLNYAMDSNVNIFDTVTGTLEIQVNCEWICKITCCLKALNNRMESQRCSNYPAFLQTKDIFTQVMSKVTLIMQLISCGEEAEVSSIITQIQELANCTDDCCGKDTPSLVGGLNGGTSAAISVVQSGGSPVTVTDVTVGDTTTYTITLDPAFVTTVSNSYNTVLANGGGITWTVSGPTNGVVTYTPNVTSVAPNSISFRAKIDYSTTTPTFTISNVQISGTKFQTPTPTFYTDPSLLVFPHEVNGFILSNFIATAPYTQYKIFATPVLVEINSGTGVSSKFQEKPALLISMNPIEQGSNVFKFRYDMYSNIVSNNTTINQDLIFRSISTIVNFLITE
jgi:hypothetical protein